MRPPQCTLHLSPQDVLMHSPKSPLMQAQSIPLHKQTYWENHGDDDNRAIQTLCHTTREMMVLSPPAITLLRPPPSFSTSYYG